MSSRPYVVITPARNEEENVARLIESMAAQTCLPLKWIIVSDGSTDGTDEIVGSYVEKYEFIELLRADGENVRSFSSKAGAVIAAYELLRDLDFEFVVVMDADMSFDPDCFETLMDKCEQDPQVGIAGAILIQVTERGAREHMTTPDYHVSGGLQLFRRACYEQIGGLRKPAYRGVDTIADIMARMHGWKVQTFRDVTITHHGQIAAHEGSVGWGRFLNGMSDYTLGYHPLFFAAKIIRRLKQRPYGLASLQQTAGYVWAFVRRIDRVIESDVIAFLRNEQKARLKESLLSLMNRDRRGTNAL